ncbi:unnamed protein product [Strongylus vulgaris]|uniref:7TM GPCR serpentine receptor class x (Srx) domain-containing protein n=1 Tax=Strongylus vulgaris TaxID=40348 RepID=A0A3P7ICM6_STRVU|nr:unnamed protein product [Strongylus vulgaris]
MAQLPKFSWQSTGESHARVVVICIPSIQFFSFQNVLRLVITLYPTAILVTWISQYVSPCCQLELPLCCLQELLNKAVAHLKKTNRVLHLCLMPIWTKAGNYDEKNLGKLSRISFDHELLSYSYTAKRDIPNYSNEYIDLPLNSSSSAICAICYSYIIFYVWKMNHLYQSDHTGNGRRIKEYRYALQFCAISMFYLGAWVTFRVFPILIGANGVEYFVVISACVTINASANAVVYITSNPEVRGVLSNAKISTMVLAS